MFIFNRSADNGRSSDVSEPFRYLLQDFGLEHYLLASFPSGDRSGLFENLIDTNWPSLHLSQIGQSDSFYRSRLMTELRRSVLPVIADDMANGRPRGGRGQTPPAVVEWPSGTIGFALHDAGHRHYLLMLSEWRGERDALAALFLRVTAIVDRYGSRASPSKMVLSSRELDCLRWAAAGKSSEEIALILSLSSHTVNEYLKQAMRKLDAVTRIQAVAAACRLGLI